MTVDANAGVPMLVLSNGGIAIYEGGSGSDYYQIEKLWELDPASAEKRRNDHV